MNFSQFHVMGILNVTPDSFSDGGKYNTFNKALNHAQTMIQQGATIIDVGGESTRPNAKVVSIGEELARVIPVIEKISANFDVLISIDTSKASVMQAALNAGAGMINDVCALQNEGALAVAQQWDVPICLMHMLGEPQTMQQSPKYHDIMQEISLFFTRRIQACEKVGIDKKRLILDPGFGFGKTRQHNLTLLKEFEKFQQFNLPLLGAISRKSILGQLLKEDSIDKRLYGSVSAAVILALKGATIIRAHDVKATVDALKIVKPIL